MCVCVCIYTDIWTKSHFMYRNIKREKKKKGKNFFYMCIYWNVPQTLFWNDIYFMRKNVKVKMLQKCIFELIYEQNHTSYILERQERKEKIWKDTNINIYIYIYIYKCTTFLFQDSTGKHVYVQLEACTCSTEAHACSTESRHMHNWSVYMLICRC